MTTFERCVSWVLDWETGTYTDRAEDKGGPTRWGISQVANPDVDVFNLSRERAAELYAERYWLPLRCQRMPAPIAMTVFDHAVHASQSAAAMNLQKLLGVTADGKIGDRTMNALALEALERGPHRLALDLLKRRAGLQIVAWIQRDEWVHVKGFTNRWLEVCAFVRGLPSVTD